MEKNQRRLNTVIGVIMLAGTISSQRGETRDSSCRRYHDPLLRIREDCGLQFLAMPALSFSRLKIPMFRI